MEIKSILTAAGLADAPVGVDIVEPPFLFEMQRQGLRVAGVPKLVWVTAVVLAIVNLGWSLDEVEAHIEANGG